MLEKIVQNLGFEALNPMQEAVLKSARHHDTVVLSPTGSGKTVAFLLPLLERLSPEANGVQALVLVPSRELALQIEQVFRSMGTGYKVSCCYGGHSVKTEENLLREAPALLIGTPGRVGFHLRNQNVDPTTIHTLVLDEFDKSLEMGFQLDMAFIISRLTGLGRRIFTSATPLAALPDFTGAENPAELNFLENTDYVPQLTLKSVHTEATEKLDALFRLVCLIGAQRTLIFCNHRDAVERISEVLARNGLVHATFHGGLEQPDRERALMKFRNGSSRILIVTDLASRGLDIPEIESIIHYQLPLTEEAFIHRNGRTARMLAAGTVYLLLTAEEEVPYLAQLPEEQPLPEVPQLPPATEWETLYLSAGKKDKVNKVDIVGLLLKKGGLVKEELGLIEVKDTASFAAVRRHRIREVLAKISQEKLKGKRIKTDIAS
jgi:superfamily II DNA/RNA helicase